MQKWTLFIMIGASSAGLGGCSLGLTVPEMQEPYEQKIQESLDEIAIAGEVQCEIHKGVQDALDSFPNAGAKLDWIKSWVAKITMKLTVDEKSALNPSVNFTQPLRNAISYFTTGGNVTTPQLFTAAVGLQASADATRVETIGYTLNFSDWFGPNVKHTRENPCKPKSSILIESDLKIGEFILNKVIISQDEGILQGVKNDPIRETSVAAKAKTKSSSPFTAFSDEVTFVVIYGGNATPTWKLVNVTGMANSPFFSATRTRTHDITIAMGPPNSDEVTAVHNAQLIGQAVATAIQSQQH